MDQAMVFTLDYQSARFTPDGKVSVVDAIRIVTNSNSPGAIWDSIRAEHPEVLIHCEDYSFQIEAPVLVVNGEAPRASPPSAVALLRRTGARGILAKASEGWETIWMLLPNYLSGMNSL